MQTEIIRFNVKYLASIRSLLNLSQSTLCLSMWKNQSILKNMYKMIKYIIKKANEIRKCIIKFSGMGTIS